MTTNNLALRIEVTADASQANASLATVRPSLEEVRSSANDTATAARTAGRAVQDAAADMASIASATDAAATAMTAQAVAARASAANVVRAVNDEIDAYERLGEAIKPIASMPPSTAPIDPRAAAEVRRLVADIDPLAAAFERTSTAQAKLDQALKAGYLTEERHAQLSAMLTGQLERVARQTDQTATSQERAARQANQAATANDNLARSTKAVALANDNMAKSDGLAAYQKRQVVIQATDAAQSLALGMPPLQVLLQQGPQAADAVGGIGKGFKLLGSALLAIPASAAAAAAAIASVAVVGFSVISRVADLSAETRAFSTTLKGMGQDAFVTTQQLHNMVETMRDAGVDKDEARGTVVNLQRNQRLTQADRGRIAGLGADVGAGLGASAADAAKKMADAFSGGYAALKKFDDGINFLTASERSQIRTMMEHGDQARALEIAYAALDRRFNGLNAGAMSQAERAWLNLGRAWSRFIDAVATSRPVIATIEFLAGAVGKIADFLDRGASKGSAQDAAVGDLEAQIAARRARLDRLRQPAADDAASAIDPNKRDQYAKVEEAALVSLEAQLRKVQDARAGAKAAEAANDNERQKKEVDDVAASVSKLAGVYGTEKNAREAARAAAEAKIEADEKGIKGAERTRLIQLRVTEATMADTAAVRDRDKASRTQVATADAVTAAYQKSLREGLKADAARTASLEQLDNKQVNVGSRTRQLLVEGAKAAGEATAKSIGANEAEIYRLGLVAEAAKGTAAAYHDTQLQVEALAQTYADVEAARATGDDAALAEAIARREALTAQISEEDRLNQTIKARREISDAEGDLEIARRELELASALPDVRERELAIMREKLRIQREFPSLGEEERQKLLQIAAERSKIKVAVEQQQRAAEETNRIWSRAAEGIQDALSSAFEAAFDKSKRAGFSFGQVLKSFLLSTASQIATAFVFKPVVGGILGAVGAPQSWLASQGYLSPTSSASPVAGADRGGGFSMPSIPGLDRLFGTDQATSAFSGVTSALDQFGTSLGFASASLNASELMALGSTVTGPGGFLVGGGAQSIAATPGALFGGTTFSSFLGGAGAGFGAGMLLNGLLGGDETGGTIGSAGGAIAGAIIGSIFPVIGTFLGGLIGGAAGGVLGGLFGGDKDDPRGYAGGQIDDSDRFSASSVHQASLDGYNNAQDRDQMKKFASAMNDAMDKYDLSFSVDRDLINANGAYNGLLTIGSMYGGAKDADELMQRWFTTNRTKAAGDLSNEQNLSEYAYQQQKGITTWYDRENGTSYYDASGKAVDRETYWQQFQDWQKEQKEAANKNPADSGSLFKTDNVSLQKVLDRLASGALTVDSSETLTKYLDYGSTFDRSKALSAAGQGTREAQMLTLKYGAEDQAKAQAKGIKEYIDTAETVFGKDSQELKDARVAARQQALAGMDTITDDAKKPLTGFAADVAGVRAAFEAMTPVLKEAGFTADQAAQAISTKLTARLAQLEKDWSQNLRDQRDSVQDPRALARRQMAEQDKQVRAEAAQLGTDSAKQDAEDFITWRTKRQEDAWKEQDARVTAALDQRSLNAAVATNPSHAREAEDKARAEAQRQELVDATNNGATFAQLAKIKATQEVETAAVTATRERADKRSAEDYSLARDAYAAQAGDLSQRDLEDRQRAARQRRAVEDAATDAEAKDIQQTNDAENTAVAKARLKADKRSTEDQALSREDLYAQMGLISKEKAEDDQRRIRQQRALEDATTAAERAEITRTNAVENAAVAYQRSMEVYNQQIALEQRRGQAAASILRTVGGAQNAAAADVIDRRLLQIQQEQELATVTDVTVRARMLETQAMEAQALAVQQAASAASEAKDNFKAFADDLKKFRDGLRTGNLSPLEGMAKLADAKTQFDAVAARALAGDKDAQSEVTGKAQTYLELAQAAYGGNQEYAAIFNQVDGVLSSLQVGANTQASIAQQQLDTLAGQAVALGAVASSLGNIEKPIATLANTAEPALTAAKTTASEAEKIAISAKDQLDAQKGIATDAAASKLKADSIAADTNDMLQKTGAMAADTAASKLSADSIAGSMRDQLLKSGVISAASERTARASERAESAIGDLAAALRSMPPPMVLVTVVAPPTPAFAAGGDHGGGWALVGERGPEFAYFGGPARIYNAEETRSMRQPANDTRLAALVAGLGERQGETNELLRALLGLTGDVASVQHDSDVTLIRTLGGLARSAELSGYMTVAA